MKIYVLNLKKDVKRRNHMVSLFENLSITNYEFIEGIDKNDLIDSYNNPVGCGVDLCNDGNVNYGAIGCAMSHLMMYEKIINETERVLILEDDVTFDESIHQILKSTPDVINNNPLNLFFYGAGTFRVKGTTMNLEEHAKKHDTELLIHQNTWHERNEFAEKSFLFLDKNIVFDKLRLVSKSYNFGFSGTYAYSPSKLFCKMAIELNSPIRFRADSFWVHINADYYYHPDQPITPEKELTRESNIRINNP
jgi:GR25 family glycosyltransferase involved in LPS biosynthesis